MCGSCSLIETEELVLGELPVVRPTAVGSVEAVPSGQPPSGIGAERLAGSPSVKESSCVHLNGSCSRVSARLAALDRVLAAPAEGPVSVLYDHPDRLDDFVTVVGETVRDV